MADPGGDFYLLRPCTTSAGFEAVPRKDMRLDLDAAEGVLVGAGYEVLNASALLVIDRGDIIECTLYRSGRMLAKTDDEGEARAAVGSILNTLA